MVLHSALTDSVSLPSGLDFWKKKKKKERLGSGFR